MVTGLRFMVYGDWLMVAGLRSMVNGVWFMNFFFRIIHGAVSWD
jgi:hypothetical protein